MDYGNISTALDFYRERGYVYVPDAPWTVGRAAYYATRPAGSRDVHIVYGRPDPGSTCDICIRPSNPDNRYVVASGEQSFLQMMLDGQELKKHVCVTPCFRVEQHNDWHKPYFMKVELINGHDVDSGHLMHMVHDAASFFERYFSVRIVPVGEGFDIVEKGTRVELGSYGIRDRIIGGKRYRWIYGTGCAEPRLSTAIMRHNGCVGR